MSKFDELEQNFSVYKNADAAVRSAVEKRIEAEKPLDETRKHVREMLGSRATPLGLSLPNWSIKTEGIPFYCILAMAFSGLLLWSPLLSVGLIIAGAVGFFASGLRKTN